MKTKSKTKRMLYWGLIFVPIILLGLFCALALLTMSPWGLRQIAPRIETQLSQQFGLEASIQGLALRWPLAAHIESFTLTDDDGAVKLAIQDARARVSLRQLLRKRIRLYRAEVGTIQFAGLFTTKPAEPAKPRTWEFPLELPNITPMLDAVAIHQLWIGQLILAPPLLSETYILQARGHWRNRELALQVACVSRGEKRFPTPPRIDMQLTIDAFKENSKRDLTLDARAAALAPLIPHWPADLQDTIHLHMRVRETHQQTLEVVASYVRSAALQLEMDGKLDLETGTLALASQATVPDLTRLQSWSPVALAGKLQADITLDGRIDDPALALTLHSDALQIHAHPLHIEQTRYQTQLSTLVSKGELHANLVYQDMPIHIITAFSRDDGSLTLREVSIKAPDLAMNADLQVQFAPLALHGRADAEISDLAPFGAWFDHDMDGSANLSVVFTQEDDMQSVILETMQLDWAGLDIAAQSPLQLYLDIEHTYFTPWVLQIGRGKIEAAGSLREDRPELSVDILELPLDLFGFSQHLDAGSELDGYLRLSGTLQDPQAELELDVRGVRHENPAWWDGPPARFRVALNLREHRLQGAFRLEDLPGDPVTLDFDVPAPLSLAPFSFDWPPDGPVEARLLANTDLQGLGRLFVLDVYHRLVGTLAVDITLDGTFNDPKLDGNIRLEGGRYEHELSGTILSDIIMEVTAERESLSLIRFEASDGASGSLQASGQMLFRPAEGYPFETALTLDRFRLMRNDHAEATGRGNINFSGNRDQSTLSGQLRVSPMTFTIPETLPPRLYALEVREVHDLTDDVDASHDAPELSNISDAGPRHRIHFDLQVDAPDRIFVRGRGLDSEWYAHLHIRGQTPEPLLTGSLQMVRGRFVFFGRRLVISQGTVTFDGAYPPDPLLDVSATHSSRAITATLRVQGPVTDPEISLQSSPPLPEDEILARILFGREAARLSPWQALTLAQAINNMRVGGNTFDLMGETRRVLRVDQIDIRTPDDEHDATTITVGKYINDRVYVELERGVTEDTGRAAVEVELSPSLRLETHIGGDRDSGIGLLWTRDY